MKSHGLGSCPMPGYYTGHKEISLAGGRLDPHLPRYHGTTYFFYW